MSFDYKTAAELCRGNNDRLRKFASEAKWAHDDNKSLSALILDLRRELAMREAEISMLKQSLMELEELIDSFG